MNIEFEQSDYLKSRLESRKEALEKLIYENEKKLTRAPEGSVRICERRNRVEYYFRDNPKDFSGKYMPKSKYSLAKKLAQKEYDKEIVKLAKNELKLVDQYLKKCSPTILTDRYYQYKSGRQSLITPIAVSDADYIKQWESYEYTGKTDYEIPPELYTEKGEPVRSKSELIIANMLYHKGIPYRYECPLYVKGMGTVYPDFTVLHVRQRRELYWEHLGMLGDEDYRNKNLEKINYYMLAGIMPGRNLIITHETYTRPLNVKVVDQIIHDLLL